MASIEVVGEFNIDACEDCEVREECRGFTFANSVRQGLEENAEIINLRFMHSVAQAVKHLNESGRENAREQNRIAFNRFKGLLRDSKRAQKLITAVVTSSVEAQIAEDAESRLHNLEVALGSTLADTPIVLPEAIDASYLDGIGQDIWLYASTGKCGAIAVFDDRDR